MNGQSSILAGRTLLLVSTGSERKRFILERMKELGMRVVVLDDHLEAWAAPLADASLLLKKGTPLQTVIEKTCGFCRLHRVEGAITFWEEEVPLLSQICTVCGFIGNSPETALNTRSKYAMQELFRQQNLPAIRQHIVRGWKDLTEAISTIGFPAIIKPLFGSDSLSVIRVETTEEAQRAYAYARRSFTMPYEKLYQYAHGDFVYQEFIEGTEFSVECAIQNSQVHIAGIHQKDPMQPPFFVEMGDVIPPRIPESERRTLEECVINGLHALGVKDSLAHVEVKWTQRGPKIIEAASRMGGDYTYHCVRDAYGYDLIEAGCAIALGLPVQPTRAPLGKCLLGRYFIPQHSGTITQIGDALLLTSLPGVKECYLAAGQGDIISVPPDGFDNAGWVTVEGETFAMAQRNLDFVFRTFPFSVRPHDAKKAVYSFHDPRRYLSPKSLPFLQARPCPD
jgi:biotin carboxylase